MKARTFASVAVMSALGLLAPLQAHAFGLGKLELSSSLNQPFQAEIVVTALKPEDEGKLQVKLDSNDEFAKAGLERSFLLTQLQFEVVEKSGSARILISSTKPVKEPFIDFLLTVTTGKGRLIREYAVLLDPPKNVFVKPQAQQKKMAAPVKKTSTAKKTTYKYPDAQLAAPSSNYSSASSYGPVGRRDTLWDIARDTKPSSVISQEQMMLAIVNANKSSFIRENINGLKAGYTLDIPSVDEIQAISKRDASKQVSAHNKAWKSRSKVATTTVSTVDTAGAAQSSDSATEAGANLDSTTAVNDEQTTARLQLVTPSDDTQSELNEQTPLGDKELDQLSEQLTLAQETIESQAQENVDIQSRMDLMEEQILTLRSLISLKDADLAKMQSSLEAKTIETEELLVDQLDTDLVTESLDQAEPEASEIEPAITAQIEEINDATDSELSEVDAYFAQIGTEPTIEPVTEEGDDFVLETPADSTVNTSNEGDSTLLPLQVATNFLNSSVAKAKAFYAENKRESLIGGMAAVLLALIMLLFRARGRKQEAEEEAEWADKTTVGSAVTVASDASVTQTKPVAVQAVEDEELINAAYASLDDIDVSASADDSESIETSEPELTHSEELVETENDSLEDATVELEESIAEPELAFNHDDDSTNSELDIDVTDAELSDEQDGTADDLLDFHVETIDTPAVEDDIASVDVEEVSSNSLDFDAPLDLNTAATNNEEESDTLEFHEPLSQDTDDLASDSVSDTLDFASPSLTELDDSSELSLDDQPLSLDGDNDFNEMSLDDSPVDLELPAVENDEAELTLDLDNETVIEDVVQPIDVNLDDVVATTPEDSDVAFDLGNFDEIDEAETKLDLAGAYMDMGDPEGARNILEEVVTDGNDEQKSRAQALLNDLS